MIAEVKSFPVRQGLFLVKIESDEGYYGWGEAGPSAWGRELAAQGLVTHFAELLKGRDPGEIGALWQEMYRGRGSGFDGGRLESAVISAIDVALHDLVARSLGIPVYQLLGGAHRAIRAVFYARLRARPAGRNRGRESDVGRGLGGPSFVDGRVSGERDL